MTDSEVGVGGKQKGERRNEEGGRKILAALCNDGAFIILMIPYF